MNRYILQPEDTITVLPPEDGAEAAVQVFCERTMIVFPVSGIREVCLQKNVEPGLDALCLTAADGLFGKEYAVLVPTGRADYAAFLEALKRAAPGLDVAKETEYVPERCDHKGHRHA